MDIDSNDLLSTNIYISNPELNANVSIDSNEEFKKYYEKELEKKAESKLISAINKIELNEDDDDNNIINTNSFSKQGINVNNTNDNSITRFMKETKTLVSIDSRDRIKTIYPKPNNFKIFLGRTFTNVKKIEMVSLEFPNTDAVINTGNNKIYWRNSEDIKYDYTVTTNGVVGYPIYNVELRTGSYTSSTLQSEIQNKINLIRRRQGVTNTTSFVSPDYHYIVSNLDIDTDVVTLTSLTLQQLRNNPFETTVSSGVIRVEAIDHGFSTNDNIYFVGARAVAGITSLILNTFHRITVINEDLFSFEVNIKASESSRGGGNTVKAGIKTPFQLLWGENNSTIAQNIGFSLENSSELIKTNVQSLENIVQMDIQLNYIHNFEFTYNYIGKNVNVGTIVNGTFITYGTYLITYIPDTISIRVQVSDDGIISNLINNAQANLLKLDNNVPIPIESYSKYVVQSFMITTFTNHNYNLKDINTTIKLSETTDSNVNDDISYDGNYVIQSIPSSTTIILPGVLGPQNTHSTNIYGTLARKTPLTTWTVKIVDIISDFIEINDILYTRIITDVPHKMLSGDKVTINNVKTTPKLTNEYTIYSVITSTSFLIQVSLVNIDLLNSINPYVGTGLMTLSFPNHNFNFIVNIENGTVIIKTDNQNNVIEIQPIIISTINPHNLKVNDIVRLSGTSPTYVNSILTTGIEPSLDGGGYIVNSIIAIDKFSIVKVLIDKVSGPGDSFIPITQSPTITGILGLNNDFYLYDIEDLGGISKTMMNNKQFKVRDIIDENTFTFIAPNVYANFIETGGGSNIYISSLKHGFNGIQENTKNNILTRSINLQGEDYCFLTCPQLNTMLNTGNVSNIFSRISLDQPPGYVCFKYLSNPKHFNTMPLDQLAELEFSIVNYNGTLYDFNDLDFSFTLQITEVSDITNSFNISSKRGVTDVS
jgi:hypothetical protein